MNLYAISDLHLICSSNMNALINMKESYPDDWLILAGDVGETEEHLQTALEILSERFAQLIWVPGNHDLWTYPLKDSRSLRGYAKYKKLVSICHQFGVVTPEDPFLSWPADEQYLLAPLFTLYDYSFRPSNMSYEEAMSWAKKSHVVCSDEFLLHSAPFLSRQAWCAQRCEYSEERLAAIAPEKKLILINHFALHEQQLSYLRYPQFGLWCGTKKTAEWHKRFNVAAVVYGHIHIRGTRYIDDVRFEEVSLGYPRDWNHSKGIAAYLRRIL